jgi:hypothetical protein
MSAALQLEDRPYRLHAVRQIVLEVVFQAPGGRRWKAIGGGGTLAEALTSAREGLPEGRWSAVSWHELYGD